MARNLIDQRYELRTLVGSGGMAEVYLAGDEVLGREVALKMLKDRYAENEEFVERFKREAKSAAALSSPYIVPIFDWGETDDGTYYITMEYVPGGTLKDRKMATGALRPQAAEVALQVAKALKAAHVRGVVHRDIKPRNILVSDSNHVKVADFGIARAVEATTISHSGDILGSAKYMSPEQAVGDPVGPASDLYSLGVVLYEMLTGRVPFEIETPADVPIRHALAPPPHPRELDSEVPEELDAITMKLLATNPEDRYRSADEVIQELGRLRFGVPSTGPPTDGTTTETAPGVAKASTSSPPSSTQPASRRRKVLPTLTILALLLTLLAVVGWGLWRDSGGGVLHALLERLPTEASQDAKRTPQAPKTVEVPTVKGKTERAARQHLTGAGFKVGVQRRDSSEEDAGKVIGQSVPGGKEAKRGSMVLLTVGEGQQVTKVPDLTGLPYSEAENRLEEAGYLLGGVEEATSDTVPAGVVMKQDPPPGTMLDPNSYVYLTDSVGPPTEGTSGTPSASAASAQSVHSGKASGEAASSEEAAVAAAVRGHYEAIGAGNFEEAYSYFGPVMRSETDEANWIAGEESSQIQSITINTLKVNEVSGNTATATVDFSSINKTETARFHIVWMLVKEGGEWKLDHQLSGERTE